MKATLKNVEPALATNGVLYGITSEGKVRKLNKLPEFVTIQDIPEYDLEEPIEEHNTKCLFKFLRGKLDGVEFKRGIIQWRGFHFQYVENGFSMKDTYSKDNDQDYFVNTYPCPADVLDWMSKIKDRKISSEKPDETEKIHVITGLKEKFLVKVNDKVTLVKEISRQTITEEKENEKLKYPNTPIGRILKAQDKFFEGVEANKSVAELTELAKRVCTQASFVKETTTLIKQFRKKEIPKGKFCSVMKKKIEPLLKEKPEVVKRAPKFETPELWEPYNVTIEGDKMEFLTKDPSGKGYRVVTEKHLYYINQVLANWPKAMSYIMKIAKGEKIEVPTYSKFIKDPFVEYDKSILAETEFKKELIDYCDNVLKHYGEMPTIFDRLTSIEGFKKSDLVEVYWPDFATWFEGKIIAVEYGIKVLYDDGSCSWVMNHQKICKL